MEHRFGFQMSDYHLLRKTREKAAWDRGRNRAALAVTTPKAGILQVLGQETSECIVFWLIGL